MGRVLHRTVYMREIFKKDGEVLKYRGCRSDLKYCEKDSKEKESELWEDLLREMSYVPEFVGYPNKKKGLYCDVSYMDNKGSWQDKKLYKEDFLRFRSWVAIHEVDLDKVSMRDIVNDLSAEAFIFLMKDNDIENIKTLK